MMIRTPSICSFTESDPFGRQVRSSHVNETRSLRSSRLKLEAAAKRLSQEIDRQIEQEIKVLEQRKKTDVNLLLLGPRESGKSTLQKQFQILYAHDTLDAERLAWRQAIHANISKSIQTILNLLDKELPDLPHFESATPPKPGPSGVWSLVAHPLGSPSAQASESLPLNDTLPEPLGPLADGSIHSLVHLKRRLSRLFLGREVNLNDAATFVPKPLDLKGQDLFVRSGWQRLFGVAQALGISPRGAVGPVKGNRDTPEPVTVTVTQETLITVRTESDNAVSKVVVDTPVAKENIAPAAGEPRRTSNTPAAGLDTLEFLLEAYRDDIKALWAHKKVQEILKKRKIKLDLCAGFYLDEIDRIVRPGYIPTDDDILKARVQTVGVTETVFHIPNGGVRNHTNWRLFDVSGARGQRKRSWTPYFEHSNAVIFMISLSCFDEYLEEDPKINRMADSLDLWRQICLVEDLKRLHLIVFLNKCDLLKRKLDAGIRVKDSISSYRGNANEYQDVVNYFKLHVQNTFDSVRKARVVKDGPNAARRQLFIHMTTLVDTKATKSVIFDVRETIARKMLQDVQII